MKIFYALALTMLTTGLLSGCGGGSSTTPATVTTGTAPAITSFTPSSGTAGTLVTITGTNFSTTAANNTVKFNGVVASITIATATQLTAVVPPTATTGSITETAGGLTGTSATSFVVSVAGGTAPTITGFTPTSGAAGTTVTITGANFSATAANNAVSFNGSAATVTSATATQLTVTVPAAATTGAVSVTTADGAVASATNFTVTTSGGAASLAMFAGDISATGSQDGTGAAARFYNPSGVATDTAGNVFVADSWNYTIRKITPAGLVTTLAGTAGVAGMFGGADGTGAAASFFAIGGIAADTAGNVYVTDSNTIRKITPAGVVTTLAGTWGVAGSADGTGAAASFGSSGGITTDAAGNVYVADTNAGTIRKITPAGVVTTLAGTAGLSGSADGTGAAARFNGPSGISADAAGNLYATDMFNYTIRKITPAGVVTTLAGSGVIGIPQVDGTGAAASFGVLEGIAADTAGNLYVMDRSGNNGIIRKVTPAGVVSTLGLAGIVPGSYLVPNGVTVSGTSLYIVNGTGVAVVSNRP